MKFLLILRMFVVSNLLSKKTIRAMKRGMGSSPEF